MASSLVRRIQNTFISKRIYICRHFCQHSSDGDGSGHSKYVGTMSEDNQIQDQSQVQPKAAKPQVDANKVSSINEAIVAQGNKVKAIKANEADKDSIDSAVKILLGLKADFKAASGQDWKSPGMTIDEIHRLNKVSSIIEAIVAQDNTIRDMKANKADKASIDSAVKILRGLKADFKAASGHDWISGPRKPKMTIDQVHKLDRQKREESENKKLPGHTKKSDFSSIDETAKAYEKFSKMVTKLKEESELKKIAVEKEKEELILKDQLALNKPEAPEESFASMLRKSKLVSLGEYNGRTMIGTIIEVMDDDLYIDFGGKFHCVCPRPVYKPASYKRGAKVLVVLHCLEMSSAFLGSDIHITLLEADATLRGLMRDQLDTVGYTKGTESVDDYRARTSAALEASKLEMDELFAED